MKRIFRVATRGSKLALWQANYIAKLIDNEFGFQIEIVVIQTEGDRTQKDNVPLEQIGGRGVFTKEVQNAVLENRADFAVHSAKDLPSSDLAPGLAIACVPQRGDVRDALVGASLVELPQGAIVATGSVRRKAQLAWLRPDLRFEGLRGNVDTRIKKAANYDAIVMAYAPIQRLEMTGINVDVLDVDTMVPQVAQGALAVECREDDQEMYEVLHALQDGTSRYCVDAERAFLATLGGGCDLPVGAYAHVTEDDSLDMRAMIANPEGTTVIRCRESGTDPMELGQRCASKLLDDGGRQLLAVR